MSRPTLKDLHDSKDTQRVDIINIKFGSPGWEEDSRTKIVDSKHQSLPSVILENMKEQPQFTANLVRAPQFYALGRYSRNC